MSALADLERKYIAALERIKQLEGDNAALAARIEGLTFTPQVPTKLKLTGSEGRVLVALMSGGLKTKEHLLSEVYSDRWNDDDEPGMKIIDVFVYKIRKKIGPFGMVIETVFGQGYVMPEETRKLIRDMIKMEVGLAPWAA